MVALTAIAFMFLYVSCLKASEVKIQIDSKDILKLFGGLVNAENFKNFANQMVQRTAMKYGTYNNPYHPEDNIADNFDRENAAIDAHLEKDNNNFISGAEDKLEDQLTDAENGKEPTDRMKELDKIKSFLHLNTQAPKNDEIFIDLATGDTASGIDKLRSMQRRFVLKGSQ